MWPVAAWKIGTALKEFGDLAREISKKNTKSVTSLLVTYDKL